MADTDPMRVEPPTEARGIATLARVDVPRSDGRLVRVCVQERHDVAFVWLHVVTPGWPVAGNGFTVRRGELPALIAALQEAERVMRAQRRDQKRARSEGRAWRGRPAHELIA